ncbi:fumarate/nitrate reduction transcriptional regulator Fnr [Alteromonadaceae bacterium M269]|nr:fumarate/nitrate reduction transcriptional regulator Fnr [Alteromonadaceae bacterium M269]
MTQTSNLSIHCQNCSINQLCLPFSLSDQELNNLDKIIDRKKPYQKNQVLIQAGESLSSLYAVRSGSFKSYVVSEDGEQQITVFHLPGDLVGFDALSSQKYQSFTIALETSMVCEIPFNTLDSLSATIPKLRQQVMRLMSNEIRAEQGMRLLINNRTAEQRVAFFIHSLAERFGARGLSRKQYRLSMTRGDIGNYLGLTIETISRIFTKFQQDSLIEVQGKFVNIIDEEGLRARANDQICKTA